MKLRSGSILFFIFLLSAIHGLAFAHADHDEEDGDNGDEMRLEMIHRYSPHAKDHGVHGEIPPTQQALIQELHRHDVFRLQMMAQKRQQNGHDQGLNSSSSSNSTRRMDMQTRLSVTMPMNAGWDYGIGQYLVKLKLGTPAQKFTVIPSTGSDLTWVRCGSHCGKSCGIRKGRIDHSRVFNTDRSSTFKSVTCSSKMCEFDLANFNSLNKCPRPLSPCRYDYSYVEGSSALGTFGTDIVRASLSNGRRNRMKDVLIGCTESIIGKGTAKGSDGILGLGFGKYSFTTKAALKYGGKVSYCLLDHMSPKNVTSYLTFGDNKKAVLQGKMRYTQLVFGNPNKGSFYGVNLQGISVGGKMLNIPLHIWNPKLGGGALVDSGMSLTFLTKPAYKPVMTALTMPLTKFRRLRSEEDDFDFCFDPRGYRDRLVPKLVFHFAGGAKFAPPVKSYVIDVSPGMKCIGILPLAEGACIIGNIIQQNHLWEFNLVRKTLGFAPSTCT
ncbi:hypothetical protein PRUPE_4G124800 [Prunus persica]|uniref:Uncharacterized protein n=1 Tax=Prunus persica TaxID=3760 RepID=M5WIE4_PRUPE|nr:aspartyl protease family protein 2 [Prunus persica]ONI11778.1 hypothetical protein PRUPE_4G124800 [Prunus persica]